MKILLSEKRNLLFLAVQKFSEAATKLVGAGLYPEAEMLKEIVNNLYSGMSLKHKKIILTMNILIKPD